MNHFIFLHINFLLCVLLITTPAHAEEISFHTQDKTELSLQRLPAAGNTLVLWIHSGFETTVREQQFAQALTAHRLEVWQIDFANALFEPHSTQLMRRLNPDHVADLIELAHQRTGKQIVLAAPYYGAIPALNGAHRWQSRHPDSTYLNGAILFTPFLYADVPALGEKPRYSPVLPVTRLPLYIFMDEKHNSSKQLPELLQQLSENLAMTYFHRLKGVTGLMYHGDETKITLDTFKRLPAEIPHTIHLLQQYQTPRTVPPLAQYLLPNPGTIDVKLNSFNGNPIPPAIALHDSNEIFITRSDFAGKVTIVNFWATWCPPCVEEIPSLNRLRKIMAREKFELLSINHAETPAHIRKFLNQVKVDFPVLLDTQGNIGQQWNVFVYPSTFVIGPDGKIKYGVNAAIAWDSPEVVQQLRELLPKQ